MARVDHDVWREECDAEDFYLNYLGLKRINGDSSYTWVKCLFHEDAHQSAQFNHRNGCYTCFAPGCVESIQMEKVLAKVRGFPIKAAIKELQGKYCPH